MIQIRPGVFETNSSSSHSIVIKKEEEQKPIDTSWYKDEKGNIHFYSRDLEFGRAPFDVLTDWYHRLCYAIASTYGDEDKIENIREICAKHIHGLKEFKFETGRWDEKPDYGYVDHQSSGVLNGMLEKYDVSLEDFIFNDRYIVIIDGDEYCIADRLHESGLFNMENIEHVYPWEWKDDGCEDSD